MTPIVIIVVSYSVRPQGYGTDRHCFLSIDYGLVWAFVGPVCAVLAVNFVMFIITLRVIYTTGAKSVVEGKHQNRNTNKVK